MKRRIACIDGHGRGVCQEKEVPRLEAGQVRVAVRASLISPGSELKSASALRQKPEPERALRPFGYTNAGVVEELGEGGGPVQRWTEGGLHGRGIRVARGLGLRTAESVRADPRRSVV